MAIILSFVEARHKPVKILAFCQEFEELEPTNPYW